MKMENNLLPTIVPLPPSPTTDPTPTLSKGKYPHLPALSIGSPSNNASNASLPSLQPVVTSASTSSSTNLNAPARTPFLRTRSQRGPDATQNITSPLGRSSQQQRQQKQHQNEGDRTDALWAEMQATLAEVELSAARGTHFFGPAHSAALEELRKSQIALAQAWARSEADEVVDHLADTDNDTGKSPGAALHQAVELKKGLEEETDGDIVLARKRREANDKYFWRVNQGVLDVVGKLEEVATAMGKVERESREIWSESESMDTRSVTS